MWLLINIKKLINEDMSLNKVWFVFFVIVSCHGANSRYLFEKQLLEGNLRYLQSEIDKTDDPIRQHELQKIADVNAHALNRLIARQHVSKRLGKGVKKVFLNGDVC